MVIRVSVCRIVSAAAADSRSAVSSRGVLGDAEPRVDGLHEQEMTKSGSGVAARGPGPNHVLRCAECGERIVRGRAPGHLHAHVAGGCRLRSRQRPRGRSRPAAEPARSPGRARPRGAAGAPAVTGRWVMHPGSGADGRLAWRGHPGRRKPGLAEAGRQDPGIAGRAPRRVVVEEGEPLIVGTEEVRQPPGPRRERRPPVAGPRRGAALVRRRYHQSAVRQAGGRHPGRSARQRAAPRRSRSARTSSSNHERSRGSTATRTSAGKHRSTSSRASMSRRMPGGSWSRTGPRRSPSGSTAFISRRTGSRGSRRRRTWVR